MIFSGSFVILSNMLPLPYLRYCNQDTIFGYLLLIYLDILSWFLELCDKLLCDKYLWISEGDHNIELFNQLFCSYTLNVWLHNLLFFRYLQDNLSLKLKSTLVSTSEETIDIFALVILWVRDDSIAINIHFK